MHLPEEFIRHTREIMGDELFNRFLDALDKEPPVSIRLNPLKLTGIEGGEQVPWCQYGFYLESRPQFTLDPRLHQGAYYVQEASSMFVHHVLSQWVTSAVTMLDLCAAPGGKTTCAIAALPRGSMIYANEPIHKRAQVLSENIQKWLSDTNEKDLATRVVTTNSYPKDYSKSNITFDVILCDVPCSGEGMFRKDPNAIKEWSTAKVRQCQQLQQSIAEDAWRCLRPGGLLIYSTCTLNTIENEQNIQWILDNFNCEVLPVSTSPEWHITGSLLKGFDQPVYRFIPGTSRGEGLFMAAMRKGQGAGSRGQESKMIDKRSKKSNLLPPAPCSLPPALTILEPTFLNGLHEAADAPRIEIARPQAISYLRREAITLPPDTPRGIVMLTYEGNALGLAKNIGNRANNLYPKEWRIRTTYIPNEYEAILRHS